MSRRNLLHGYRPDAVLRYLLLLLASGSAYGDDTHPRLVAALGPDGGPAHRSVWETAIAVGQHRVVSLFDVGWRGNRAIGYALYEADPNGLWEWTEAIVPLSDPNDPNAPGYGGSVDPSIVFDPITEDFLGAALDGEAIKARLRSTDGAFEAWRPLSATETVLGDKPYMVSGELFAAGSQELYVVGWPAPGYYYRRSTDGGATWVGDQIFRDGDPTDIVRGTFCAQPIAASGQRDLADPNAVSAPLFVGYTDFNANGGGAAIGFLEGQDLDQLDPNNGDQDQFMANVAVDERGRIHVVFYDDREYDQDDGAPEPNAPEPRFDFFYAVSPDGGSTWIEKKLVWTDDPNEPTIDLGYPLDPNGPTDPNWLSRMYFLGEYTSITVAEPVCWGSEVWTAFSGTWSGDNDPNNDKSVIWYSRMRFSPDLNGDGVVDLSDLAELLAAYNCWCGDACYNPFADFDADCCVGLSDLGFLLSVYGQECETIGGGGGFAAAGGGGDLDGPALAPLWIEPIDTGGYADGSFNGEVDHFVFDLNVSLADPNDAWTTTGIVVQVRNGATFRLSSEPTAPDEHATFVSSPRLAIPADAGDTLLAGAYDPPEQSCQFETTAVNFAWLDALGGHEGLGAVMRLVIDVSGVRTYRAASGASTSPRRDPPTPAISWSPRCDPRPARSNALEALSAALEASTPRAGSDERQS